VPLQNQSPELETDPVPEIDQTNPTATPDTPPASNEGTLKAFSGAPSHPVIMKLSFPSQPPRSVCG
jgi:hypothetical protein